MIAINSVQDILIIMLSHNIIISYSIIFCLMFIEGPIITYIVSFAASLGYLNIWIIFILATLGNQVPDNIFYFIGRSIKQETVERFASFFKINRNHLIKMENSIRKHSIKSLLIFKIVPQLPIIGLISTGYVKMPYKKFFWATLITNIICAAIFTLIGFYSGLAISSFFKYFKIAEYFIIPLLIVLIVLIYFGIKHFSNMKRNLGSDILQNK